MKKPYTINFHSSILSDQSVNHNFAQYCLYPISFAHTSKFIIPQATLLNQYCRTFLSYAELYEIQAKEAFTASVEMHQQQLFLFFMLEGCIRCKDEDGDEILELQSGNYCSTYKREGNYHAHFKEGTHRLLVISYRHDWSKRITVDYPHTAQATSFPQTVQQAEAMHANNELIIEARAYKEAE